MTDGCEECERGRRGSGEQAAEISKQKVCCALF